MGSILFRSAKFFLHNISPWGTEVGSCHFSSFFIIIFSFFLLDSFSVLCIEKCSFMIYKIIAVRSQLGKSQKSYNEHYQLRT